jgi:hypothetical protein
MQLAPWVFIAGVHDVPCILTVADDFSEFPALAGVPVASLASLLMLLSFVVGIAVLVLATYSRCCCCQRPSFGWLSCCSGGSCCCGVPAVDDVPAVDGVPVVDGVTAVDGVPSVGGVPAVDGVPVVDGVPAVNGVPTVIGVLLLLTFLK